MNTKRLLKLGSLMTGLLVFSGLAVSCSDNETVKDGFTQTPLYEISMNDAQTRAAKIFQEKTAAQVYEKLEADNPEDNVCYSPLSLQMALSMFTHSCGETLSKEVADKYLDFFGVNSLDELEDFNSMLINELPKVDGWVKSTLANSVWEIGSDIELNKEASWMKKYGAEIFSFQQSDPSIVKKINEWTLSKTNNRIQLLDPDTRLSDPLVMYINALYFLGKWSRPFSEDKMTFTDVNGVEKKVDALESHGKPSGEYQDVGIINGVSDGRIFAVIPFGNGGYRMYAVLPAEGESIAECASYISGINFMPEKAGEVKGMITTIPAFEINYEPKNIVDILRNMGYPVEFVTDGGISATIDIKQKTFFKMTKDGAEGAGATFVGASLGVPTYAKFDRPFIYYVREQSTGTILFIGSVKTF